MYNLHHRPHRLFALFIFRLGEWPHDLELEQIKVHVGNRIALGLAPGLQHIKQVFKAAERPHLQVVESLAIVHVPLKLKDNVQRDCQELRLWDFGLHKQIVMLY